MHAVKEASIYKFQLAIAIVACQLLTAPLVQAQGEAGPAFEFLFWNFESTMDLCPHQRRLLSHPECEHWSGGGECDSSVGSERCSHRIVARQWNDPPGLPVVTSTEPGRNILLLQTSIASKLWMTLTKAHSSVSSSISGFATAQRRSLLG
jgi:hypothetical protein